MDLWQTYVHGYLEGCITVGGDSRRVIVVRHEDIISCPEKVVAEPEKVGIPRNTVPFVPIEESVSRDGSTRSEILSRYRSGGPKVPQHVQQSITQSFSSHQHLLDRLGYRHKNEQGIPSFSVAVPVVAADPVTPVKTGLPTSLAAGAEATSPAASSCPTTEPKTCDAEAAPWRKKFPFLCLVKIKDMHAKPKYNGVHGRVVQQRRVRNDEFPRFDVILRGALDGWCLSYVHPENMVKISNPDPREVQSAMNGPGFDIPRICLPAF